MLTEYTKAMAVEAVRDAMHVPMDANGSQQRCGFCLRIVDFDDYNHPDQLLHRQDCRGIWLVGMLQNPET